MDPKYQDVVATIKKQIINGDYVFKRPPSGRALAVEAGVSYLTARRALQQMLEEKIFIQKDNGRLELNSDFLNISKKLKIALVRPNWYSPGFRKWFNAIAAAVEEMEGILKTVSYSHINDPIIQDVLDGEFDLIFLEMNQLTPAVKRKLETMKGKIISLFQNRIKLNINSVEGSPPESLDLLLGHLYGLKHRRVGFLMTEPAGIGSDEWLIYWKSSAQKLGIDTVEIRDQVKPFEAADLHAYKVIKEKIKNKQIDFTALFSISVTTAHAAMRAFYEEGYKIGKDISICSVGDPTFASLTIPSITVVNMSDPINEIKSVIQYTLQGNKQAKLFRVMEYQLQLGESTGRMIEKYREITK